MDLNTMSYDVCKGAKLVPIIFDKEENEEKESNTQHDSSSEVDHDLMRPLQDEAFVDDF